jgi:DNA-binding GntR family transcriptional regulator
MAEHQLDLDSPVPLPQQLAAVLRARIEAGELAGRIPSANDLGADFSVSRDSGLKAIALLKSWGLVTTARGKGTFVIPPEDRPGS